MPLLGYIDPSLSMGKDIEGVRYRCIRVMEARFRLDGTSLYHDVQYWSLYDNEQHRHVNAVSDAM